MDKVTCSKDILHTSHTRNLDRNRPTSPPGPKSHLGLNMSISR